MRRGCLSGGMFWGTLLIVLGLLVVLNVVFHVAMPVGKIILALLFFYFGIRLVIGSSFRRHRAVVFNEQRFDDVGSGNKYDIVFGRGDVDLTRTVPGDRSVPVEVNNVFGACVVTISPQVPVRVIASSAFGSVRLPDGNVTSFGEYSWKSPNCDESRPHIQLHVSAVFAGVRVNYA
jgi:predicted membrane protein